MATMTAFTAWRRRREELAPKKRKSGWQAWKQKGGVRNSRGQDYIASQSGWDEWRAKNGGKGIRGFAGAPALFAKPTKKHRPAVWENMLGTVMAASPDGEVKYFDYDHAGALAFAGVGPDKDPRVAKAPQTRRIGNGDEVLSKGKTALWITRD